MTVFPSLASLSNFLRFSAFVLLMPALVFARTKPVSAKTDSDYLAALACADHFLHAWQTQDQENGLMMLTDSVRQHWPQERLEAFFASADNSGYEISRGRKLKPGRYVFPVALLESSDLRIHKRNSQVIVTRTGKQDWEIDKLP